MTEKLLQHIWQFKYFNTNQLVTVQNQAIEIIFCGELNTNEGPDFLNARIKIDGQLWAGHVELHLSTSAWDKHKHNQNPHYKNVILHVVFEHDKEINNLPTLSLQGLIARQVIERYGMLMQNQQNIPCQALFNTVKSITLVSWQEKLMIERLEQKTEKILSLLQQHNNHWDQVFWVALARAFGTPINADAFELMANNTPVEALYKSKNNLVQLEAILMGQAGLLQPQAITDAYFNTLSKEYNYIKTKYNWKNMQPVVSFLRMRPATFPTIRLSQLAMLIYQSTHLISKIKDANHISEIKKWLHTSTNDYWLYHYQFAQPTEHKIKKTGNSFTDVVCINTIVPLVYAMGLHTNNADLKQKALAWWQSITAEKNSITKQWEELNWKALHAGQSQAQIHLYKNYCTHKRCLQCAIGNSLLKQKN
jgi:hypothetical protein